MLCLKWFHRWCSLNLFSLMRFALKWFYFALGINTIVVVSSRLLFEFKAELHITHTMIGRLIFEWSCESHLACPWRMIIIGFVIFPNYLISHGIIKWSFLHPERGDIILLKKAYFLSADKFNDLFTSNFCTEQDLLFFQLTFIKEEKA